MRIAGQVGLAYIVLLLLSAVWRFAPVQATPDVVALFGVYLGLTARGRLAPTIFGAVLVGYLADLLMGTPRGMLSLTAGLMCVVGHLIHHRLIVRGRVFTVVFSAVTALSSGVILICLRVYLGVALGSLLDELLVLAGAALLTGLFGPPVFKMCRMVDARFARTQRDRVAALEGLGP